MRIGVNLATVEWGENFEQLPLLVKGLGADGLEFPIQLWLEKRLHPKMLSSIDVWNVSGILHRTLIFPESIFVEESCFKDQLTQIEQKLQAVKGLQCRAMSLGIDPWTLLSPQDAERVFLERVKYLASKLAEHEIALNLEYISHKIAPPCEQDSLFCPSLKVALDWIDQIGLSSVKLLLDVIHWFADEASIEPETITDKIGFVHLCDHPDPDALSDLNRVLPFEGKLPLQRFIRSVEKGGYKGDATIEVFRTERYQPPFSQVQKAVSRCKNLGVSSELIFP